MPIEPNNVITRTFFSIYYNTPNYIDVVWTPLDAVNGKYTINVQLQPNHAILIRRTDATNYNLIYTYFNGTTTEYPINFSQTVPVFISQQVLYTDGNRFSGSLNYVSKNPIQSITEEYHNGAVVSNWTLKFTAKFE